MQDSATAADYFELFIDQQTIDDIRIGLLNETHMIHCNSEFRAYALIRQILFIDDMFAEQNAVAKGARNWKPVLREEMKAFIAILIISNHVVVPRDERLFLSVSRTKLFGVPGVRNILSSRFCFFELHLLLRS